MVIHDETVIVGKMGVIFCIYVCDADDLQTDRLAFIIFPYLHIPVSSERRLHYCFKIAKENYFYLRFEILLNLGNYL